MPSEAMPQEVCYRQQFGSSAHHAQHCFIHSVCSIVLPRNRKRGNGSLEEEPTTRMSPQYGSSIHSRFSRFTHITTHLSTCHCHIFQGYIFTRHTQCQLSLQHMTAKVMYLTHPHARYFSELQLVQWSLLPTVQAVLYSSIKVHLAVGLWSSSRYHALQHCSGLQSCNIS